MVVGAENDSSVPTELSILRIIDRFSGVEKFLGGEWWVFMVLIRV